MQKNMKHLTATFLAVLLVLPSVAQPKNPPEPPPFAPGKYCCKTPETGYVGCLTFKSDGSYEATGKFHDKEGTARGTWRQSGKQIILAPQKETGSLVGYFTRFSIDDDAGKSLTWLPKVRQDFSRTGGAVVYPRYEKSDEKGI
jgi:hypothetical protein